MKAAVHYGKDGIRVEDRPDPVLSPNGIIIKIRSCGICGSDLHPTDTWDTKNGMILGHEFSGDVIDVGKKVSGIQVGDRVTAMGYENCGACYWCGKDMPHRCTGRKYVGYDFPGGFAEYVSIPVAIPVRRYSNCRITCPMKQGLRWSPFPFPFMPRAGPSL